MNDDGGIQWYQTTKPENYMPKLSEMLESKFLKKEEVDPAVLVTINRFDKQNVAKEGAEPEFKWTAHFEELDKPLVLNSTNLQMIAMICGSEDSDEWIGHKIVLYNDPNVSFGGKITGGIRVRKPKAAPAKLAVEKAAELEKRQTAKPRPIVDEDEDSVPF